MDVIEKNAALSRGDNEEGWKGRITSDELEWEETKHHGRPHLSVAVPGRTFSIGFDMLSGEATNFIDFSIETSSADLAERIIPRHTLSESWGLTRSWLSKLGYGDVLLRDASILEKEIAVFKFSIRTGLYWFGYGEISVSANTGRLRYLRGIPKHVDAPQIELATRHALVKSAKAYMREQIDAESHLIADVLFQMLSTNLSISRGTQHQGTAPVAVLTFRVDRPVNSIYYVLLDAETAEPIHHYDPLSGRAFGHIDDTDLQRLDLWYRQGFIRSAEKYPFSFRRLQGI